MRKAFASAAILVSSTFALTIEQEHRMGQTLAQPQMFPTDLAMTMDGDAVDITDYTAPEDDGTWQVQGEKKALPKLRKKVWKWIKNKLEEAKRQREEECEDSDCDDDKCDPNDSDCGDDDCDGDDCDDDKCDPNDSDCGDDDCDGDDCDDDCDGDDCDDDKCDPNDEDCNDDTCDDDSCEPDKEESEPSCENVMHKPQSEAEYNELVASAGSKPILVKFGTQSCGACKHIKEFTEQLAKDTDCRKMMFIDGDLNKIGKAYYPYKLQYIPTFVVLVDGEEAHKEVTTNESKIQAMVDNYGLSEDEYCDDCDDDSCDDGSCEPDKDDTCDGDDCDDGSCDDGSCEPDKEESEPSCENVMHKPQSEDEYNELVASAGSKPILVKFGTQSCGACKNIKEYTEQLAKDTDCRKMMFIDGDLNKIGKAWYPYKLQYIPTFVVLVDGEEAHKEVTTNQDKIQAMVDNYGLSEDEYCDDCDDDTCDGDSCEPDKDNCDDGSCEPDKEEEPSCENVMHHPQSQAEYEELVASAGDKPILIKFGTQGCGACRAVKSWTEQQAKDTDCRKMMFIDGDLNKIGSAWYPYKLQYIPTFVVAIAGETMEKKVTQRESEVQAMIDKYGLSEDEYCDDCGDDTCDGDSCEPEQDEEPACENKMLKPQSQAEYEQMVKDAGSTPVMVKFGTEGCGACRNVKAISEQIASETDCRVMKFIDGDLNKIGSAWYPYKLQYIPTFVVLQDGKEVAKKVTTKESDLRGMVSQYGDNQDSSAAQLAQLRESTMMQHPQSADEFDEMIAAAGDLPVQVKFTMNDCEACDYCDGSSEEIAGSVDEGDMQFIEANINLVGEVRYRYNINAVPTFIVLQKGREIAGSRFKGGDASDIQSQVDDYKL